MEFVAAAAALPPELKPGPGCTGVMGVDGVGVAGGSFSVLAALGAAGFFAVRFLFSSLAFFDLGAALFAVDGVGGGLPWGDPG